jgi:hypothetical protein
MTGLLKWITATQGRTDAACLMIVAATVLGLMLMGVLPPVCRPQTIVIQVREARP